MTRSLGLAYIYGDGKPEGVRQRAAEELFKAAHAAKRLGSNVVNGFTGSSIWHLVYSFPPRLLGHTDFANLAHGYRATVGFIVIDNEDIVLGRVLVCNTEMGETYYFQGLFPRLLAAVDKDTWRSQTIFGFNYDPNHFGYQAVDYMKFTYKFQDRIFHVHMKDVAWNRRQDTSAFGGHIDFHKFDRYCDFKFTDRGNINFDKIIRALNDIDYAGPLRVEWEDGGMDRDFGATESCAPLDSKDQSPWPTNPLPKRKLTCSSATTLSHRVVY